MAYNPNIPLITDPILQSAAQIKANYQAIDAAFNDNHISLEQSPDIAGMHNTIIMRPQSADPTTSATQTALYSKLVTGIPELFFRPNSNQTPIQLTYPSLQVSTFPEYTFMAGPFIIYGGFINTPTQGQLVTLTPGTSLKYVDLTIGHLTPLTAIVPALAEPTNITGTSFNITYPTLLAGASFGVYFFAIGV